MKSPITSLPLFFIGIFIFMSTGFRADPTSIEVRFQDKSPEIMFRDKNNKVIGLEGVNRSDASTVYIEIKSDNEKDVFVIQEGKVYIPNQKPKKFKGPRITANMMTGNVTVSLDKLVRRLEDGTFEEVKLESKFAGFRVK